MTSISQPLDISMIWQEGWNNATLADIIQNVESTTIAYEAFGYFNLFFGRYGVFNNFTSGEAEGTNSTNSSEP